MKCDLGTNQPITRSCKVYLLIFAKGVGHTKGYQQLTCHNTSQNLKVVVLLTQLAQIVVTQTCIAILGHGSLTYC